MNTNQTSFDKVLTVTHELMQIQDLDLLLERMLTEIRSILGADAGSIYIIEDAQLKFSFSQNDTLQKKMPFGKKFTYSTFIIPINNKSMAGYVANTGISLNIPDAYNIDPNQPYSFEKQFDDISGYRTRSVLSVPIKTSVGKVIGVIQLINALNSDKTIRSFTNAEEPVAMLFANSAAVAISNAQMTRAMIWRMVGMVELHDPTETIQHANRVAASAVEIYEVWAHKKGVPEKEIQHTRDILRMAAMLHDIGKIAIPTSILHEKKENLLPAQLKALQSHTFLGARLFYHVHSPFDEMAQIIALSHHERWDGSGYPGFIRIEDGNSVPGYDRADGTPFGKSGPEIPIFGRIVAVANAYDTLTHELAVQQKLSEPQVVNIISSESGKRFDPEIVGIFVNCLDVIRSISSWYPD